MTINWKFLGVLAVVGYFLGMMMAKAGIPEEMALVVTAVFSIGGVAVAHLWKRIPEKD